MLTAALPQDPATGVYLYRFADIRPWDPRTDLYQYEHHYVISTKTRHKHLKEGRPGQSSQGTSLTASLISVDPGKCGGAEVRVDGGARLRGVSEGGETSSCGGEHEDTVTSSPVAVPSLGGQVLDAGALRSADTPCSIHYYKLNTINFNGYCLT